MIRAYLNKRGDQQVPSTRSILKRKERKAMPYWLAYLMLLVLGTCVLIAAFIH